MAPSSPGHHSYSTETIPKNGQLGYSRLLGRTSTVHPNVDRDLGSEFSSRHRSGV
jgi:hypothetical protein